MEGWMDEQMNYKSGRSPVRYSRERIQTTPRLMYMLRIDAGKQIYMEHRKTARETVYVCECTCMWE